MKVRDCSRHQFPGWAGSQERKRKERVKQKERSDGAKDGDAKGDTLGEEGAKCERKRSSRGKEIEHLAELPLSWFLEVFWFPGSLDIKSAPVIITVHGGLKIITAPQLILRKRMNGKKRKGSGQ
jgi:hypothetical protein